MVRKKTGEKKKKTDVFDNQIGLSEIITTDYTSPKQIKLLGETNALLIGASMGEIANRAQLILNTLWESYTKNRKKNNDIFDQYCKFEKLFYNLGLTIKYKRNDKFTENDYYLINNIRVYYNGKKSDFLMSYIIMSDRQTHLQRLTAELGHDYFDGCKIVRIADESVYGTVCSFSLSTNRSTPRFSVKDIQNSKSSRSTWNTENCYLLKEDNGKQYKIYMSMYMYFRTINNL